MGAFFKDTVEGVTPPVRPYTYERPLTAAASRIKTTDKLANAELKNRQASQKWQDEAWDYFDLIGEISYAYTLFSNILSRIRIHAAYIEDDQDAPTPIRASEASEFAKEAANEAMNRVFGAGKQSVLLRKAGINLLVVGECYLINVQTFDGYVTREEWKIVSTNELVAVDGGFALKKRADAKVAEYVKLAPDAFMGRIWKEHPRYSDEPISSMKALCELCNELLLLSRAVKATARSRLNAGAFFVPDEFSVSQETPTDEVDDGLDAYVEEDSDEFEDQLVDAMTTPVSDPGSVNAVVPLLIRGPAELGEKMKLIKFERAFDPQLSARADRALERILQGIDMPKEMITGLANIKYSNAIQINDSFYTAHIEPLVLMLCDTFRTIYLEPALRQAGVDEDEVAKIVIWYDPSGITTAPDKSAAANVGYDKLILSGEAWRRNNGFTEDDAPTPDEIMQRVILTRGPVTPELTDTVLRKYAPEILEATRANTLANSAAPIPDEVNDVLSQGAQAPPATPTDAASPAGAPAAPAPTGGPASTGTGTGEPVPPPQLL